MCSTITSSTLIWSVYASQCQYYDKEDGNYLDEKSLVYIPDQLTLDEIEDSLFDIKVAQGQAYLASLINNTAIPTCPCKSLCDNVINLCGVIPPSPYNQDNPLQRILSSPLYPKDCSGIISNEPPLNVVYPTDTTSSASLSSCNNQAPLLGNNQLILKPRCFPPAIIDEYYLATNTPTHEKFCVGGCCVKCPQTYSVYPDGWLEKGFAVTQSFRVVSAVLALIMSISYILLPGKRTHPGLLILFTSIAIFIFSSLVFFSIGDPKKIQCVNDIDPISAVLALIMSISYILLPGKRTHPGLLILFTSIAIFIFSSLVFFSIGDPKKIQCVNDIDPSTQSNNILCAIQGALIIFASFATTMWVGIIIVNLHIHTVWSSNCVGKRYIILHLLGWGIPAFFTVIALATSSVNYEFATLCFIKEENAKLNRIASGPDNSDFKDKWIQCIQSGNGQDKCYYEVSLDRMPPYSLLMLVELLPSLIGIWLFVIFANGPLWTEWKIYLKEKLGNKRKTEVPGLFFDI
ncbi:13094_t:CDS:2 [Entrophospora sp. SA101]|nr:13094_t:CDS:2 [Entrophospora sp. SA101]